MKTDRVLTMDECLNEWGIVPTRVEPAACDARHVPIAEEMDVRFPEERTQLQLRSLGSSVCRLCSIAKTKRKPTLRFHHQSNSEVNNGIPDCI